MRVTTLLIVLFAWLTSQFSVISAAAQDKGPIATPSIASKAMISDDGVKEIIVGGYINEIHAVDLTTHS